MSNYLNKHDLDKAAGKVQEKTEATVYNIATEAANLGEALKEKAIDIGNNIRDHAVDAGTVLLDKVCDLGQEAVDKTQNVHEKIVGYIKDNPLKAVGIAFFLGLICAKYHNT